MMNDHEIAKLINDLRDVAIKYHDTQQLRERIAGLVVPVLKATPSEMREDCGFPDHTPTGPGLSF